MKKRETKYYQKALTEGYWKRGFLCVLRNAILRVTALTAALALKDGERK
jgi:hypothetical protein